MLTMSNATSGPFRTLIGATSNPYLLNLNKRRNVRKQVKKKKKKTTFDVHFLIPRLSRRRSPQDEPARGKHPCKLAHLVFDVLGSRREPV